MIPHNEPIFDYSPAFVERDQLKATIAEFKSVQYQLPMIIKGQRIKSEDKRVIHPPHETAHVLGHYFYGDKSHVIKAIDAALSAKESWMQKTPNERAAIFLKAADLASTTWRNKLNAATMLCQSKNAYQSEIDAACELIDFLRFNVHYMNQILEIQPYSPSGIQNILEQRPLEGFVYALTPFNFTAIACNLPTAPALMGNTVVWKPADSQIYSAYMVMELLKAAGLPDGVINLIYVDGPMAGDIIFSHSLFAGLHFTGSTQVFNSLWQKIADNLNHYKSYPRIVGETGGKNFLLAHPSARPEVVVTALIRGAFEYQGQKCSATSRAYISKNIWKGIKEQFLAELSTIKVGSVEDFSNFVNAVIDEKSFNKIAGFIDRAQSNHANQLFFGGEYSTKQGYFIHPTVFITEDPYTETMTQEIFGPVLTIFLYEDDEFEQTLTVIDQSALFGLTGAIIAEEKDAVSLAMNKLRFAAGNFYINDKSTGAVVNQQPFGGGRASGTNDKAGSLLNLLRWTSPRAIKENFNPPTDYRYGFMKNS